MISNKITYNADKKKSAIEEFANATPMDGTKIITRVPIT